MRPTTRFFALFAVSSAALSLAACGGGGGGTDTGASPAGTSTASGGHSGAYQGGFEICSTGPLEEVAATYGVPEVTPEAVAESIAEAVSGGTPREAEDAKQGCLAAFEQSK